MKKELPSVTLISVEDRQDYLPKVKIAADICQKDFSFGSVKILSPISDNDSRVVKIQNLGSVEKYSEFCIQELWKYVETDFALVFQYDGFILNPDSWTDEFLQYDYIGAPWYHMGSLRVGNGGFSLRSKRLLDFIGKNYKKIDGVYHPEDLWVCKTARPFLEEAGFKFAPEELAKRFSKEGSFRGVIWNDEFGFHGLNYTDISKWFLKSPEYKESFPQHLDDFTKFMLRHPVYDGTFHVLLSKPRQIINHLRLENREKNYDCRIDTDLNEFGSIQVGHEVIYMPYRIDPQKNLRTFERKVTKVEKFSSKKDLAHKYPDIQISISFNLPRWQQRLSRYFGNIMYPNNLSYTVFWFE